MVAVALPKFKVTTPCTLGDELLALGMARAFSDQDADFTGISKHKRLTIDQVIHKAHIAVDEKGTAAAAATAVIIGIPFSGNSSFKIETVLFKADHPFIYLIRDNRTGSILFLGRPEPKG